MKSFMKIFISVLVLFIPLLLPTLISASTTPRFKAVAFDYFVIFNPDSVVPEVEKIFPGKGAEFTKVWRAKQFEYGFLRSITHQYQDFFEITSDALTYAAESMHLDFPSHSKEKLLSAYLHLQPWPDAVAALEKLKSSGVQIITIANFSSRMLAANAKNAGIADLFTKLLSTEVNRTYKPNPKAYELGMKVLHLKKEEILFAAFGGWDAYGAKTFGYPTYWVNRFHQPMEKLGVYPDATSEGIDGLVDFVFSKENK